MKEFDTAIAAVVDEDDETQEAPPLEFKINQRDPETGEIIHTQECYAYQPEEGQVIMVMASLSRYRDDTSRVAAVIDFLEGCLDDDSSAYIGRRLMDRKDPYGYKNIEDILFWLMEEWGGRPTKRPSDFAQSRKATGPRSTPRTSRSKSSASARTGS